MSLHHLRAVWQLKLDRNQKYMLLALADCANDQDECWPGIAHLAEKTGYDISSVKRLLVKLIRGGLIVVVAASKRGQTTRYRLRLGPDDDAIGAHVEPPTPPDGDPLAAQYEPSTEIMEVQHQPPSETDESANGSDEGLFCSNGGLFCVSDSVMTRAGDPKDPLKIQNPPIHPPKGGRYPYEFEYYFWDNYPNPVGKQAALRAFNRLRLTLPQLVAMRTALLAHRRYNPRWRPDEKGRVFIPNPATWLRQGRFDDPVPGPKRDGPSPPCGHPPGGVTQAASGVWFCNCGHRLSPAEAEAMGLTAEANDNAREALAQIQAMLGGRSS